MGGSSRVMTFRELVESRLIAKGFTKQQIFALIYTQSGVSFSSSRAAFNGTRVLPETADTLWAWGAKYHDVDLDRRALMSAPTLKGKKAA